MKTRTFIMMFCLALLTGRGLAQTTVSPVVTQTFVQAPYMYRLQDWTRLSPDRMQVRIRMLDTRVPSAVLYLKMELESSSLKIENPEPIPVGIPIAGGEEIVLDAGRLALYFMAANVRASGRNVKDFSVDGILPDGLYQLRFKAYEAVSGTRVSIQETPALVNLVSGEPPLITSPAEDAVLYYTEPCHIRFQWLPRHLQYASGFRTEYEFELAEIPKGVETWREYFQTLPRVYRETTENAYVDYDMNMPALIPGKRYAVRVRATCTNTSGESLYIKNDGYSKVQAFSYVENCPSANGLRVVAVRNTWAEIAWTEPVQANFYRVFYRKNGKADARWYKAGDSLPAGTSSFRLTDLTPSTGYECKVSVKCAYTQSEEDIVLRFTTLSADNAHLDCGNHNLTPDTTRSTEPLAVLRIFDQIRTANGFVIDVEEVSSGGQGVFSGKGNTHIPLLSNTGVRVSFNKIFVNKNYELVSGVITAERE